MKLTLNPTAAVETRRASREPWRTAGKRRRAIRPPLAVGERILLWLRLALHPHERHTILDRFVILWVLDLRPVRPPPPPDCRLGRIYLLRRPEEILDELGGLRCDCRRGVHVHRRPHRRCLALSRTLPHGPHRPRNLPLIVKPSKDLLQPG